MIFIAKVVKNKVDNIVVNVKRKFLLVHDSYSSNQILRLVQLFLAFVNRIFFLSKAWTFNLTSPITCFFNMTLNMVYFLYVSCPVMVMKYLWQVGVSVCCRRSTHARRFFEHADAMITIGISVLFFFLLLLQTVSPVFAQAKNLLTKYTKPPSPTWLISSFKHCSRYNSFQLFFVVTFLAIYFSSVFLQIAISSLFAPPSPSSSFPNLSSISSTSEVLRRGDVPHNILTINSSNSSSDLTCSQWWLGESEVLSYEEVPLPLDEAGEARLCERRMRRLMHRYVPSNSFRATVRHSHGNRQGGGGWRRGGGGGWRRGGGGGSDVEESDGNGAGVGAMGAVGGWCLSRVFRSRRRALNDAGNGGVGVDVGVVNSGDADDGDGDEDEAAVLSSLCSPSSFPATPFSRACVLSRSADRVDSVMFAVRDVLRVETQLLSRDAHCRDAARLAEQRQLLACFCSDPTQLPASLLLSCGHHCVHKVTSLPASAMCRGAVSVARDAFVYFEFSITVSSCTRPCFSLGLTSVSSSPAPAASPRSLPLSTAAVVDAVDASAGSTSEQHQQQQQCSSADVVRFLVALCAVVCSVVCVCLVMILDRC